MSRIRLIACAVLLLLGCATDTRAVEVLLTGTPGAANVAPRGSEASGTRAERESMVRDQIERKGIASPPVLAAMRRVRRHEFVESRLFGSAYGDYPLPIGHGQTISQPYIVGLMTELLRVEPGHTVLEVGTGSGYQAAVLAELAQHVVSIEIVAPLAQSAAARLERLGYRNVTVVSGDGYFGWEKNAPYDSIVVTAAATHVPPPLIAQLKPGGRMAIPVGETPWTQNLLLIEKDGAGRISTRSVTAVRFVPLTRGR
jgi:protein-L-isoaspartate(D-aspartate) O-methyltransferase